MLGGEGRDGQEAGRKLAKEEVPLFARGRPEALGCFEKALLRKFAGKMQGRLGGDADEIKLLSRIVRRTTEGCEWGAQQKHAELIVSGMGLLPCRAGQEAGQQGAGRGQGPKTCCASERPGPRQTGYHMEVNGLLHLGF